LLGCFGGCCIFLTTFTALITIIMIYVSSGHVSKLDNILEAYLITKSLSLAAGVFPIGFISYAWSRRQENIKEHRDHGVNGSLADHDADVGQSEGVA
jgi:O-antigen/teichoic acid export membrane protein